MCGKDEDADDEAAEAGYGTTIVPLKLTEGRPAVCVDNPLIHTLAKFASLANQHQAGKTGENLPDIVLGLCCNNWGMYSGRNALIEALLEIMGPCFSHKLSIHSALYALEFNTRAVEKTVPLAATVEEERATRKFHAEGFQESARKYSIGLDLIEENHNRFDALSKEEFVDLLSSITVETVERALSSDLRRRVLDLVGEILVERRRIQENLSNKRFRRARSLNGINDLEKELQRLLEEHFSDAEELLDCQLCQLLLIPGWEKFTESAGGAASAVLALFCHSVDVLAGCIAKSNAKVTPRLAERLVLTILQKDNQLLEYVFNQVYDLMPSASGEPTRMYIYRSIEDIRLFSAISCGVADMGGKL